MGGHQDHQEHQLDHLAHPEAQDQLAQMDHQDHWELQLHHHHHHHHHVQQFVLPNVYQLVHQLAVHRRNIKKWNNNNTTTLLWDGSLHSPRSQVSLVTIQLVFNHSVTVYQHTMGFLYIFSKSCK